MSRRTLRFILGFAVIVVLLAAAWFTGWKITGKMNPLDWTKQAETEQGGGDDSGNGGDKADTSSTLVVYDNAVIGDNGERLALEDTYDMPSCLAFVNNSRSTSLTDGTSVTLKATVTPENATDKRVKWTSSAPEYVSVTPISEGSTTATVTYIKGFNEPVIITCMSLDSPQYLDNCRVDCLAIPSARDVAIDISDSANNSYNAIQFGKSYNITATMDMLSGTYFANLEFVNLHVNMSIELCNDIAALLGVSTLDDYSYDVDCNDNTKPVLSLPSAPWAAFGSADYNASDFNSAFCRAIKDGNYSGGNALILTADFNLTYNGKIIDTLTVDRYVGCDVSNIWTSVNGVEIDKDNVVLG